MAYARTSLRKEKRDLREQMRSMGLDYREIAAEFARRYSLRPRAAWREAYGWSLQDTADRINDFRGNTGLDPGGFAGMTAPHLSEYEGWPGHAPKPSGRRPTPYLLAVLAAVYDCPVTDLVDLADRRHMSAADLLILDKYTQPQAQARRDPGYPRDALATPELTVHSAGRAEVAAPREMVAASDSPGSAARTCSGTDSAGSVVVPWLPGSLSAGDTREDMRRREFLFGVAGAVGFASAGDAASASRHVAPELIPYFQQQLEGHYRADMLLGPRALISTVVAQFCLIAELTDNADNPTRQRMAAVGTSFATFAAWLYLDAGDIAAAMRCHDAALEMAHRSRNREAVACALVDRAMARTDQGAGSAVVDLCSGALADAGSMSPEIRVFALQQQAHGASLLGDRGQVDALLDTADSLISRVDAEVWGTACLRTPNYVEVQRATCYGRLGLAGEALGIWQQIIPAIPSTARRDGGVWAARQAALSASIREPERAVEFTRHAVKVALETGSARVLRELGTTESAMIPWQAERVGREFAEVLSPVSERI